MSLLAALRTPLRASPALRPALARAYVRLDGGDPESGRWETSSDPNATESEADVRADQEHGHRGKPDPSMQEATAAEAERQYRAEQPVTDKVVEGVKRAVKTAKDALK
ncbi:unnamed protein product [Cutaneotrichosporon oleaginosum]